MGEEGLRAAGTGATELTIASTIELRAAERGEAATIRDVVRNAYAKWVPVIGREPLPMQVDYAQALHDHQFVVAVADGGMVGLIETVGHEDHVWIENVAVVPEWQGRGIGQRLLADAERRAAEAACFETRLVTNGAFEATLHLYARLGYVVDRQEPFMNGAAVYMSKRLER